MLTHFPKVYYPQETEMKKYLFIDKLCRDKLFDSYNESGGGIIPNNHGLDYILQGKGHFFDSQGKKINFDDNSIIVTPRKIYYDYKPSRGQSFESLWVRFNGELADNLMDFFAKEQIFIIKLKDYSKLRQMFQEMFDCGKLLSRDSSLKATGMLTAILTELKAQVLTERGNIVMKTKGYIEAFYTYAADNYDSTKLSIAPFLAQHNLGYETFRKNFRKVTGMYPYSYWLEIKFNKAKSLLEYSKRSISEIAYTLGYDNLYAFSKFFKTRAGSSPSEYRKNNTH